MKNLRWIWLSNLVLGCFWLTAPAIGQSKSEKYANLPSGHSDSGLPGSIAAEVFLRTTEYATGAVPDCRTPSLRYSTVPLRASLVRQSGPDPLQETEIWYLECPAIIPVVVRYRKHADGHVDEIRIGPFSEFMAQIKYKPLSLRRNPAFDFDAYFGKRPAYEPVCFGKMTGAMATLLSERVPRLKEPPKGYGVKALCIRLLICNTIEPEIDILHDTIMVGAAEKQEDVDRANELGRICGRLQENVELLFSEEPETTFGMNATLPLVTPYTNHFYRSDR
jgi:hypothetical protein